MKPSAKFQMLVGILLNLLLVVSCSAQTAKFQGKVVETLTGKPVSGVEIAAVTETDILEEKPYAHLKSVTDEQGIYYLKGAIPSVKEKFDMRVYKIQAKKEGYLENYLEEVTSPPENKTTLAEDIKILRLPPEEGGYIRLMTEDKFIKLPFVIGKSEEIQGFAAEIERPHAIILPLDTTRVVIPRIMLNANDKLILYMLKKELWEWNGTPFFKLEYGSKGQPIRVGNGAITMPFDGCYQTYFSGYGVIFGKSPNAFKNETILNEDPWAILTLNYMTSIKLPMQYGHPDNVLTKKLDSGIYCSWTKENKCYLFEIIRSQ